MPGGFGSVREAFETLGADARLEFARSVLSSDQGPERAPEFVDVARLLSATYEREFVVHCLRYYVAGFVEEFLFGVVQDLSWSSREKALALEGLLPLGSRPELLSWALSHPDSDVVETAILNTDWTDHSLLVLDDLVGDPRRGPATGSTIGDLVDQIRTSSQS